MTDEDKKKDRPPLECSCVADPFAALPPELRPKPAAKKTGLRKVTCPGCGLVYWTNRATDFCVDCVKKGLDKVPEPAPIPPSENGEQK